MRPIAIDLFAGAGGMSLGFEQAGFDVKAAVEIDPVHCATHKFNFPKCSVIPRSVEGLKGSEIRVAAGLGNRTVDVVFGGAPCQGFSMIGQRVLDDPRNRLVGDFLRIVSELDATYFVFENVKGLTVGKHRKFLDEFIEYADELGYEVRKPWQVLDAANYSVPQHRERLILFGAQKGENLPDYPAPWTNPADGKRKVFKGLPKGPTVSDALSDIPDAEGFEELRSTDEVTFTKWGAGSTYAFEMRCRTNSAWHRGEVREWNPNLLTSSARTEHTEISRRRFSKTAGGETEPISRFYKLHPEGLSNTLRAGTDGARGAFTSPRPIHPEHNRCVTVREMARLHGYPDWFRFNETKWHGARQIGNSVPPPLARAIASEVWRCGGYILNSSAQSVPLGDEKLLRMTVRDAATYFGIEAPPSKRNMKSGSKKRKQEEIEKEIELRRSNG
ncbi:DNA cytosine methyltransferase [Tsuneonella suprasediminis]|uniref:Cytosine-specific methyltransferase n=1 Tax=Tsuneonella suprasediminis TaxID=2306996 RepID=A0A419R0Q8_9SPHN|nr:DNA cytosine methyltransferase [Tsuneonella suprasediminis]RJX67070.1 DNA cytosine methyltransferase [Tsuneonella suprasediminis]